jgi:4-amino-4-deoxychorismate lyase
MVLINSQPGDSIAVADRGLSFGDGVFRTLECIHGRPRLWPWQYARLQADTAALGLECPHESLLLDELARAAAGLERAVGKITLTRGSGTRGYAPTAGALPTRVVNATPWGGYPAELVSQGIRMRVCDLRLAQQPRLAGIKHLNRLENVLARGEWHDPAIREGLLLDCHENVIEGTMSNLFLLADGQWRTPLLDQCGVAGAVRAWVMAQLAVEESRLSLQQLLAADALFVCNSLAGIWPVASLGDRCWGPVAAVQQLAARLRDTA